ncbi:hypothetical protein ABZ719_11485 [Streptomyces sp. NPDC006743]|uniref:hypothetical protein n=1 Tax=Streptomyces sp. NPDC006743 TaxID=3154480 RepID=UPI0034517438
MLGRPVARPGHIRGRHVRGFGAALVAVAALVAAANANPAPAATDPAPAPAPVQQAAVQDR